METRENNPLNKFVCYTLNTKDLTWEKPLSIAITVKDTVLFFHNNPVEKINCAKAEIKHIEIPRDAYAYFTRYIPSDLLGRKPIRKDANNILDFTSFTSTVLPDQNNPACNQEYKSLIVIRSLMTKSIEKDNAGVIKRENLYPCQVFHVIRIENNKAHDEEVLSYLRKILARMNYELRYSYEGIKYQLEIQLFRILCICFKQAIYYLLDCTQNENLNEVEASEKIEKLLFLLINSNYKKKIQETLAQDWFYRNLLSLIYKTTVSQGLFPSYIEINTMNESKFFLWIKRKLTNIVTAPWGSQHHASFSLGIYRYSFINIMRDKSKQNRVSISHDFKRDFSNNYNYTRFKFFDFFPRDKWIEQLTSTVLSLLQKIPGNFDKFSKCGLYRKKTFVVKQIIEAHLKQEENQVISTIANEFYEHYQTIFDKNIFMELMELVSESEMKGYSNLQNNCQIVVSNYIKLIRKLFQGKIQILTYHESDTNKKKESVLSSFNISLFNQFSSDINDQISGINPFKLKYKLNYFGTYGDQKTSSLWEREAVDNTEKLIASIKKDNEIKCFITVLSTAIENGRISNGNQLHNSISVINDQKEHDFSFICFLHYAFYNELFACKRKIKRTKLALNEFFKSKSRSKKENPQKVQKEYQGYYDELAKLRLKKMTITQLYNEVCFYYYNAIRYGHSFKLNDVPLVYGSVIIRNPEKQTLK